VRTARGKAGGKRVGKSPGATTVLNKDTVAAAHVSAAPAAIAVVAPNILRPRTLYPESHAAAAMPPPPSPRRVPFADLCIVASEPRAAPAASPLRQRADARRSPYRRSPLSRTPGGGSPRRRASLFGRPDGPGSPLVRSLWHDEPMDEDDENENAPAFTPRAIAAAFSYPQA
jgi:hypothetical protein